MTEKIRIFFTYSFLIIPISLITGPAIPDLTITFGCMFALIWIILNKKQNQFFKNNLFYYSILFWLSLLWISFFSYNKQSSFQDSIIYLRYLLIPICCYFLYFEKEKIFQYLLLLVFVLTILVCVDTMFQFFNYNSREGFGTDILGFKSNWYGRLTGPFGDELIPGSYVSKFGLIGFAYLVIKKNFKYKTFIQSSYLAIILIVSFISGERMAFATFLLGLFSLLVFLYNYRSTIFLSIFIGLICIFSIFKLHPFYNDYKVIDSNEFHQGLKIEKTFECEEGSESVCSKIINIQPSFIEVLKNFSTSAYGEIYLLSLKMFKDNPITGVGINNFKYLCKTENDYKNMMINYNCASHPHNIYIQWLAEGGIIVFSIFILYISYILIFILKNKGEKELKIVSIVLLLILFWPIMSTGSLIKNWYGVSTYFIIGISLCLSRLKINY